MREGEVGKFPLSLFVSPSLCQLLSRSFLLPLFFKESENSRLAFCVVKNESGEKRERECVCVWEGGKEERGGGPPLQDGPHMPGCPSSSHRRRRPGRPAPGRLR